MPSLVRLRVPLGFAAAVVYLWLARPTLPSILLGAPFVLAGEALRVWASGYLTKNRALTTAGPYRHTRHPLYLGSALLVVGFALGSGSLALGAGLVAVFALVYAAVARREEEHLNRRFGPEYAAWCAAVPALVPRLRAWEGGDDAAFSWAAVRRHRELRAVTGAALLLAFLAVRVLYTEAP